MKVLVTGRGLLATAIKNVQNQYRYNFVDQRVLFDLSDPKKSSMFINAYKPDVVIHAAKRRDDCEESVHENALMFSSLVHYSSFYKVSKFVCFVESHNELDWQVYRRHLDKSKMLYSIYSLDPMYGPNDRHGLVRQIMDGSVVNESPDTKCRFLFSEDVANIVLSGLEKDVYELEVDGVDTTFGEIAQILGVDINFIGEKKKPSKRRPHAIKFDFTSMVDGLAKV